MSENYGEYKRNLYTKAMGCVDNGDNVYADRIPVSAALARFASERVESYETGYVVPGNGNGAAGRKTVVDKTNQTLVRLSDSHIHGRFGAVSMRRQYEFLIDLATGVTGEGRGDLRIVALGTTRNGGRAYLQLGTGEIAKVAGMEYAPFINLGMAHDGSLSVVSTTGVGLIICANMVGGIFGAGKLVKGARVKQSKNATDASIITKHSVALELSQQADEFETAAKALASTVVTNEQWEAIVQAIAPVNVNGATKHAETRNENAQNTLHTLYSGDKRCAEWQGSALGVMQTLNTFDLWERGTRGDTNASERMADEFLSGKLAAREEARAALVGRILATV